MKDPVLIQSDIVRQLEIRFVDFSLKVVQALHREVGAIPGVEVVHDDIFAEPVDALVSPANSYGFLDGGIDQAYTDRFGPELQVRLQEKIARDHGGELLVGVADIVPTGDDSFPWLIVAPTMRVPRLLEPDSIAPYQAVRAVLRLVATGRFPDGRRVADEVHSLALPGLGTGVGGFSESISARQSRAAIEEARSPLPFPRDWWEANERHQRLYSDKVRDLQFPPS